MSFFVEQIYTNCLAQASYYIESDGVAAIIDPLREPDAYLALANARGSNIQYVFETHFHADFVSGHQELASKTGATIIYGPEAVSQYPIKNLKDEEVLNFGSVQIKALHTPGHTPESTCYLVQNPDGTPLAIFTGDTLFVGDVGRPDLLEGVIVSKEEQLKRLYTSLERIKQLPADLIVYPAHGPGSMCGKSIGSDKTTTIGKEIATNYALQPMDFETFCATILDGQLPAPRYFVQNALINRAGYKPVEEVVANGLKPLTPAEVKAAIQKGAVLLDSREATDFGAGFIKGAINVGLGGQFAIWVGTLFDTTQPLVIVTAPGKEIETLTRLSRVGFDHVLGIVATPKADWANHFELDTVNNLTAEELVQQSSFENVLDVRKPNEWATAHLPEAQLAPLRELQSRLLTLDKSKPYQVHCAAGYRSMIAVSLLKAAGFEQVTNVIGGWGAIEKVLPANLITA